MKIEKISDNQIRCTLNSSDLHSRSLNLSDLAYGNKKAKHLFAEMMHLAGDQFGFRVDDKPLMVEAVPLSGGGLILMITKVDDVDELDTRFARFCPDAMEAPEDRESSHRMPELSADMMNLVENLLKLEERASKNSSENGASSANVSSSEEGIGKSGAADGIQAEEDSTEMTILGPQDTPHVPTSEETRESHEAAPAPSPASLYYVYSFRDLDTVIRAAHALKGVYQGKNRLFKSSEDRRYYLVVHRSGHSAVTFNKVCNILAEYSNRVVSTAGSESYFMEHLDLLIGPTALQDLAQV